MTKFLMSVYDDGSSDMTEQEIEVMYAETGRFNDQIQKDGSWVFGGGLLPITESTTVVDGTKGDVTMTDGPFAEAKEYIAGFWVIEAADLDAALEIAGRASKACGGPVEVRPFGEAE